MKQVMDNRGVTLIEMAMVLAVAAIAATIAIPNYLAALPKIRVNQAMAEVSGLLIKAKLKAITDNVPYRVAFNTANNTVTIWKDEGVFETTADDLHIRTVDIDSEYPGIVFGKTITNDAVGGVAAGSARFVSSSGTVGTEEVFYPNGSAKSTGAVYLIPAVDVGASRYDRCRAVSVVAMTGFVKSWKHDNTIGGAWY